MVNAETEPCVPRHAIPFHAGLHVQAAGGDVDEHTHSHITSWGRDRELYLDAEGQTLFANEGTIVIEREHIVES